MGGQIHLLERHTNFRTLSTLIKTQICFEKKNINNNSRFCFLKRFDCKLIDWTELENDQTQNHLKPVGQGSMGSLVVGLVLNKTCVQERMKKNNGAHTHTSFVSFCRSKSFLFFILRNSFSSGSIHSE
jgi:hypothetical protein